MVRRVRSVKSPPPPAWSRRFRASLKLPNTSPAWVVMRSDPGAAARLQWVLSSRTQLHGRGRQCGSGGPRVGGGIVDLHRAHRRRVAPLTADDVDAPTDGDGGGAVAPGGQARRRGRPGVGLGVVDLGEGVVDGAPAV